MPLTTPVLALSQEIPVTLPQICEAGTATDLAAFTQLDIATTRQLRAELEQRADALTAKHHERKTQGIKHPVEDFLYTYYPFSPAQLRRWHPGWWVRYDLGADASLANVGDIQGNASRRWYLDETGLRRADVASFIQARGEGVAWIYKLLQNSTFAAKPGNFACFGLHEWAMVYKLQPGQQRHENLPLRLSQAETDEVVQNHKMVCTHIDAFRFFTPEAVPLNASKPTRQSQIARDNPACLHVGMDLYKWAMKIIPLIPSSLALDCFEHALQIRILDMEASPYDCQDLGYGVVPIETEAGKAEYVRRQRELATVSDGLRQQLLHVLNPLANLLPNVGI